MCEHIRHGQILLILTDNLSFERKHASKFIGNNIPKSEPFKKWVPFYYSRKLYRYGFNQFRTAHITLVVYCLLNHFGNRIRFLLREIDNICMKIFTRLIPNKFCAVRTSDCPVHGICIDMRKCRL